MAVLNSLTLNNKDVTASLTSPKLVTVTSLLGGGNYCTGAWLIRFGNVCQLYIEGKMNQLPNVAAWNSSVIMEFPIGYRPAVNFLYSIVCDGENNDWTKNYYMNSADGRLYLSTRADAYAAGNYASGHGYWFSVTYITTDDYPS